MLNQINLSRVDLNLLVLFDAVMAERHVGRAADRLNLTASAVSHGLGRLRRLMNDPLFLRTPKGVVPTERATVLAAPIADILAQVGQVVSSATPFDPATSTRRFAIGAPDAILAVILPQLLTHVSAHAPGIDLSLRQILPPPQGATDGRFWDAALADLDARVLDLAFLPLDSVPARFAQAKVFTEDFVIVMRRAHALSGGVALHDYCAAAHVVVSLSRDDQGFVDVELARLGLSRRVALAVPNFMFALAILTDTDLIAALPRTLALSQAAHFGLTYVEAPLPLPHFPIRVVATRAALADHGTEWLFRTVIEILTS